MSENKEEEKVFDMNKMSEEELRDLIREFLLARFWGKKLSKRRIIDIDESKQPLINKLTEEEFWTLLFRRAELKNIAEEQGVTTECPQCKNLVPNIAATWFPKDIGGGFFEIWRFCTFCETEFKLEEKKEAE